MKILIADDDVCLSHLLREGLSREGFVVHLVSNGQDALVQAMDTAYDVILLDVVMPGLDGYAVLRKLKALGNRAAILMVSCKAEKRDKLRGLNNGADDYLDKPIRLTELVARISAVAPRKPTFVPFAASGFG